MIQYILKNNGRKDLRSFGPRMPISLCIPSRTANRAIGNEIGALIDTGASRSAVSPTVAVRMGLQQIGIQKVSLAGRSEVVPTYAAAIYFPRQKFTDIQLIELLGLTLPDQPVVRTAVPRIRRYRRRRPISPAAGS